MTRTIEPVAEKAGVESTQFRPQGVDPARQREVRAAQAVPWSFEEAFEQACTDMRAIFRGRHEVKGLLLIGLENGLLVATPFEWASEEERASLHERLSREFRGHAEYYIYATELSDRWSKSGGATARILRIVGVKREQGNLSRCWRIHQDPIPRLVEQDDVPRTTEPLSSALFNRVRPRTPPKRV